MEAAARELPALQRHAAVLALRVSERKILAQVIAHTLDSYAAIVEQLKRTTGGTAFLAPLTLQAAEQASGEESAMGTLELALAFAEGHGEEEEEGGGVGEGVRGLGAGEAGHSAHGHLRHSEGDASHRAERQ